MLRLDAETSRAGVRTRQVAEEGEREWMRTPRGTGQIRSQRERLGILDTTSPSPAAEI